jgi:hypothetical protein
LSCPTKPSTDLLTDLIPPKKTTSLYPLVGGLVKVSVYALGLYAEETQAVARLQGKKWATIQGCRVESMDRPLTYQLTTHPPTYDSARARPLGGAGIAPGGTPPAARLLRGAADPGPLAARRLHALRPASERHMLCVHQRGVELLM